MDLRCLNSKSQLAYDNHFTTSCSIKMSNSPQPQDHFEVVRSSYKLDCSTPRECGSNTLASFVWSQALSTASSHKLVFWCRWTGHWSSSVQRSVSHSPGYIVLLHAFPVFQFHLQSGSSKQLPSPETQQNWPGTPWFNVHFCDALF